MVQWEEWFTELITYYRKEYKKLSTDQKVVISNLDNLASPCQLQVLWAANNQIDSHYQMLIFTHFPDEQDMSFNVYGPFEPYRFTEYAAEMLRQPRWQRSIPKNEYDDMLHTMLGYETYREYLVGILNGYRRRMEYYFNSRASLAPGFPNMQIAGKQGLLQETKDFVWEVWGDIRSLEVREIVDQTIRDARSGTRRYLRQANRKKKLQRHPAREEKIRGFGALIHPRIWIGDIPPQSLEERIEGKNVLSQIILSVEYKRSKIIFRQDGFIGITLGGNTDSQDREKAVEILNEIAASFLIMDIPIQAFRETDIVDITIDPRTNSIIGMTWGSSDSAVPRYDRDYWGYVNLESIIPFNYERKIITEDVLRTTLDIANKLTKDKTRSNLISFLLEAYTLFHNAEYSQSFLSSWLILETYIQDLWTKFLTSRRVRQDRASRLKDPNRWTADYMLETLNLTDRLEQDGYNKMMKLKSRRNAIVHSGKKATKAEAEECLKLASEITKDFVVHLDG